MIENKPLILTEQKINDIIESEAFHLSKIGNYHYAKNVLGVDVPLCESYLYPKKVRDKVLNEHMLFEGFWSGVVDVLSGNKGAGEYAKVMSVSGKQLLASMYKISRDGDKVPVVVSELHGDFVDKQYTGLMSFLKLLLKNIPVIVETLSVVAKSKMHSSLGVSVDYLAKVLKMISKLSKYVSRIVGYLEKWYDKLMGLTGWKSLTGMSTFSVLMDLVQEEFGEVISSGREFVGKVDVAANQSGAVAEADASKFDVGKISKELVEAVLGFVKWWKTAGQEVVVKLVGESFADYIVRGASAVFGSWIVWLKYILALSKRGIALLYGPITSHAKGISSKEKPTQQESKLTEQRLNEIIEEEMNEIFGFGKKESVPTILAVAYGKENQHMKYTIQDSDDGYVVTVLDRESGSGISRKIFDSIKGAIDSIRGEANLNDKFFNELSQGVE